MTSATVVDYGMGNLFGVRRTLEYSGCGQVIVASDPACLGSADPAHVPATYDFGGHAIWAAIRPANSTGFQFHPEKSGCVRLEIMKKFVACS